jgi:hypothetical protein
MKSSSERRRRRDALPWIVWVFAPVVASGAAGSHHQDAAKPQVPLVMVVGCASRAGDGAWMLTNASEPKASSIVHADASEVEAATRVPLGNGRYRLIGTAEFASVDELLGQGQRALFTSRESANASGQLVAGHKVSVKALLIAAPDERRLNLLSVQSIGDACP